MVRTIKYLFIILLCSFFPRGMQADQPLQLRVLTYNIHHGEGADGKIDLNRIANVISEQQPDLVALQEVDNGTKRSGGVDQTAELARLTKMEGRFAKQIEYEGGGYGQAILTKFPIQDLIIHVLPGNPERERRMAGIAKVTVLGIDLQFATTHLHHARSDLRLQQANELVRLFPHNSVAILAGDMNAIPGDETITALAKNFLVTQGDVGGQSEFLTFPSITPTKQLDFVAAAPASQWKIVQLKVLEEPLASDHRPLLATLEYTHTSTDSPD